jgi:hypothetical protein
MCTVYFSLFARFCSAVWFSMFQEKKSPTYQNPALLNVTFKSFWHWGGSKIAQISNCKTLIIMQALRHKSFKSSIRYIHIIVFNEEDFEGNKRNYPRLKLSFRQSSWQKYDEATFNGITAHFYRKPKRFGGLTKC